ncbi:DegV family protein [Mycolicibacillus parakoreensis]|uniref:DegV family protein n=1 Tax=Mycolicibacillus parakoreensis TaxID=1069221 RepID=A0ABY3U6W4_9MYCO|nr:DegV family protein [Mycolicibacillus parakoreensis]MCV7314852.1 DegV family protein [Mycolicibacillus parakoreensis]ULN53847.1 DegV family protein [Mycolicibacillus parakoreensis]
MTVVVVTDSAARIPRGLRQRWGIRQVPLHILVDGTDLRDDVDDLPDDLLQRRELGTAAASPEELRASYRAALAASGGDGVVAVHVSAGLSGMFGAAEIVAADTDPRIVVVDSRSTAMGTGFVALAAARAAADGGDVAAVRDAATAAVERSHTYVVVHRLDSLRRSGRISGAGAWLGTALALKPLLHIDDGKLVLAQRVRTAGRAVAAMIDKVVATVGQRPATVAVHHVGNPDGAADLADRLAQHLPQCDPPILAELAPVLALHVGTGALGVCLDVH